MSDAKPDIWSVFLRARARLIHDAVAEGQKSDLEIAHELSVDPDQVRLISEVPVEEVGPKPILEVSWHKNEEVAHQAMNSTEKLYTNMRRTADFRDLPAWVNLSRMDKLTMTICSSLTVQVRMLDQQVGALLKTVRDLRGEEDDG